MSAAPIFVVGIPRSGTTLVRLILDSHPSIACGPETPWLCAHHERTIQRVFEFLAEDPKGYCKSFGMERTGAASATGDYVRGLLDRYAAKRGKQRWAEKTPGNAPHLSFLRELFPDALFVHVTRELMDVAASTAIVSGPRAPVSEQHLESLDLAPGVRVENRPFAAAVRHRHWDRLIRHALQGARTLELSYERLVANPELVSRQICEFVGEAFDEQMLRYRDAPHDLPDWEWGTAEFDTHRGITDQRVGRGADAIGSMEVELINSAVHASPEPVSPCAALGSLDELESDRFRLFMDRTNALARALGLREVTNWSKVWEYPWLWRAGLNRLNLPEVRVIDIGSERSVMPWLMALLGTDVTLIETDRSLEPLWSSLRSQLDVKLDWRFVDDEAIPLADSVADAVTSFSVIEHQADRAGAINEIARVLKPGGMLAMSFDVCEEGMTFPHWNGRAMNRDEFESEVWAHRAFASETPIQWNEGDIAPFHAWHKTTAPHHDYVVAAAVLVKCQD